MLTLVWAALRLRPRLFQDGAGDPNALTPEPQAVPSVGS
jgi:hypothetical protein